MSADPGRHTQELGFGCLTEMFFLVPTHPAVEPTFKNLGPWHAGPKLQADKCLLFCFFNMCLFLFFRIPVYERKAVQLTKPWWEDKAVRGFLLGEQVPDLPWVSSKGTKLGVPFSAKGLHFASKLHERCFFLCVFLTFQFNSST